MPKKTGIEAILIILALVALVMMPWLTQETYVFHILCLIGINIIFAASLNAILNIGELNLAQSAFMGIGAYASTLLMTRVGLSFWFALPVAALITAAISLLIGLLTLRFKGAYFLLFTFLFAELIRILLSNFGISIFGGIPGLTNIPRPSIELGSLIKISFDSKIEFYYLILLITLGSIVILSRIDRSRTGMIFWAISQSESLTESIGINSMKFKILGVAIGCFFAGVAGSLYAHFVGIITPTDFAVHSVLAPIAYVVVGGMGTVVGPVIGTTFLMVLSHFFLRELGFYELLVYGLIIVGIIRFMPEGLISVPRFIFLRFPDASGSGK
ncbi:MAG: branched-chain amino acid ABC transporter permease [Desulfomonilaceae bacterium]